MNFCRQILSYVSNEHISIFTYSGARLRVLRWCGTKVMLLPRRPTVAGVEPSTRGWCCGEYTSGRQDFTVCSSASELSSPKDAGGSIFSDSLCNIKSLFFTAHSVLCYYYYFTNVVCGSCWSSSQPSTFTRDNQHHNQYQYLSIMNAVKSAAQDVPGIMTMENRQHTQHQRWQ